MPFPPCPKLGLYAVVPNALWVERLVQWARESSTRVGAIQLREKTLSGLALTQEIERAVKAVTAVQGVNLPLFINDHWREALQAGAYGVHLGQEDLDRLTPNELETLRLSGLRLGVSTHSHQELARALMLQPSYVAMGAIFPTTTKTMPSAPQGLDNLRAYLKQVRDFVAPSPKNSGDPLSIRTVAIGGIFVDNAPEVLATGVDSLAVVRALTTAVAPEAMIRAFNQALASPINA